LWRAYLAGRGNIASDPDVGNRTHMRGVAADLQDYSPLMQRALVAAGLQRDPAEAWHWQLPNWRDYPIIPELVTPTLEGPNMAQIQYYERVKTATPEWMIGGRELPGGFVVTEDAEEVRRMGRQYSGEGTIPVRLERPLYVAQQAYLAREAALWEAQQVKLLRAVLGGSAGAVSLQPVLDALSAVPTAAQNGAAARAAIVK